MEDVTKIVGHSHESRPSINRSHIKERLFRIRRVDWSSTLPISSESTKREQSKKSKTLLTTDDADLDDDAGQDSPEELDGNTLAALSNLDNMNRYVTEDHAKKNKKKKPNDLKRKRYYVDLQRGRPDCRRFCIILILSKERLLQIVMLRMPTFILCLEIQNSSNMVLTTKFAGAARTTLLVASSSAPHAVLSARPLATSSSMPPSASSSTASPQVHTMSYSYSSTTPFVNNREKQIEAISTKQTKHRKLGNGEEKEIRRNKLVIQIKAKVKRSYSRRGPQKKNPSTKPPCKPPTHPH
ncbi:unnamed protein product [Brassica rapa subsp. trilocularis]